MTPLSVSVIVVSWNVAPLLRRCLASLMSSRNSSQLEVIVIDNASADDSARLVRDQFPTVKLTTSTVNLGFARAVNLGLGQASGEFLFLLNPDAEVEPETISRLTDYLIAHPAVGVVGPKILNADGSIQDSIGRFPRLSDQIITLLGLDHLWSGWPATRRYTYADRDREQIQFVDQVKGAAFFVRRSVVDRIGLFDQGFFLWFEEVDFSWRAARAGLPSVYLPTAVVRHVGGESFRRQPPLVRHRMFLRSLNRYFWLRRPRWEFVALQPFVAASFGLHVLASLIRLR